MSKLSLLVSVCGEVSCYVGPYSSECVKDETYK